MTIFPGLVSDVEPVIINNCDTNSLVQLSGVNKKLYQTFSNNKFFKNLFETQHQALFDNGNFFKTLRSFHPSNCWKVMSQLMNSTRDSEDFPRQLDPSFIGDAITHFLVRAEHAKRQLTEEIKAICGSHYQDPNSPIDKAWKAYKKCAQDLDAIKDKMGQSLDEIDKQLLPVHPEDRGDIVASISQNPRQFQNISAEEFLNIPEEERQGMLVEHLPVYHSVAELLINGDDTAREISNLTFDTTRLAKKYKDLESDRHFLNLDLRENDREVSTFMEAPAQAHSAILAQEFRAARRQEDYFRNKLHLEECSVLIGKLIDDPEKRTPENLNHIRSLINACSFEAKKYIWSNLYFMRANSVIEDRWSEKHFQHYLATLQSLVKKTAF